MISPWDSLVSLTEEAIADTYRWARSTRWLLIFTYLLLVVLVVGLVYLFTHTQELDAPWLTFSLFGLSTALIGHSVYRSYKHLAWIYGVRAEWEGKREEYTLRRMESMEFFD